MNDVSNDDLDEGFDGEDDVTIAASSDALALIRETAKNLRTDDDPSNAHVPGTRTQAEEDLADDPTLPARPNAHVPGTRTQAEEDLADDPTLPASAYLADAAADLDDPTLNPGDAGPDVLPEAANELADDATAVRETEATASERKANSQRAAASARAQVGSASRHMLDGGASLIGSDAPPESSTNFWDPTDGTFDDLDAETLPIPRKRFPRWVLLAAFVAAAVVLALAIFVAIASAQGVS